MTEQEQDVMFCRILDGENGEQDRMCDFFESKFAVEICRSRGYIARVAIIPDEAGAWWCWRDAKSGMVHFVWPSLEVLSMCFGSGMKTAVERGDGMYFQARVEVLERYP